MNCYMDTNIDKSVSDIDLDDLNESELEVGDIVDGVIACNFKDFSFIKIGNLSCMLPLSEISYDKNPRSLKVGTKIQAVVIRLSDENGVMLSIKRATKDPWSNIDEKYRVGQRVNAKVTNILCYGVFVELEKGLSGFIHQKDLSIKRRVEPEEIVTLGQTVDAEILSIDKEKRKIQLSMKSFLEDPWTHVTEHYSVGQKFILQVTKSYNFGAFFELEPGIDALLHRNELELNKSDKVKDFISAGDELEVEIVSIDIDKKKINLKCDSFSLQDNNNNLETNE